MGNISNSPFIGQWRVACIIEGEDIYDIIVDVIIGQGYGFYPSPRIVAGLRDIPDVLVIDENLNLGICPVIRWNVLP